jgi:pyruvate dehydrogenase E1 component
VARALEPWSFGIYAGGQSILVGTPSGVTLGPEGGAHQSVITPSIGIEQPGCTFWEPAFGQDLEWAFLHALSRLGREDGEAAYFRLSTRPLDQALQNGTREEVLSGGYRLRPADDPRVVIAVMGALVPEAVEAADILRKEADAEAEVVCITSADLLYRSFQGRAGLADADPAVLDRLFPHEAPVITLLDGHPHTLSFLGDVCLGVQRFGQSGDLAELYEHHSIDAESVVGAALDLMD